jgi:hypothetical protein
MESTGDRPGKEVPFGPRSCLEFPENGIVTAALDPSIASSLLDDAEDLNAAPGQF